MVIFPLAPDQTIAQMWSDGAWGANVLMKYQTLWQRAIQLTRHMCWRCCLVCLLNHLWWQVHQFKAQPLSLVHQLHCQLLDHPHWLDKVILSLVHHHQLHCQLLDHLHWLDKVILSLVHHHQLHCQLLDHLLQFSQLCRWRTHTNDSCCICVITDSISTDTVVVPGHVFHSFLLLGMAPSPELRCTQMRRCRCIRSLQSRLRLHFLVEPTVSALLDRATSAPRGIRQCHRSTLTAIHQLQTFCSTIRLQLEWILVMQSLRLRRLSITCECWKMGLPSLLWISWTSRSFLLSWRYVPVIQHNSTTQRSSLFQSPRSTLRVHNTAPCSNAVNYVYCIFLLCREVHVWPTA